jgi:hypothetical protein
MKVTRQVESVANRTGKSKSTVWRWLKQGCDLSRRARINQFLQGNKRRQNPDTIRQPKNGKPPAEKDSEPEPPEPDLNQIELGPVGKLGAAAALARLEEVEERAHSRLQRAIEHGNLFEIRGCQEFYLRSSEVLRRLDLAVEVARRSGDEQVPKFLVEQISTQISGWLRAAFEQFLSSESLGLMAIADLGEFKFLAIEQFRGILHATVKVSLRTNPPIPPWAAAKVVEAWNVPGF